MSHERTVEGVDCAVVPVVYFGLMNDVLRIMKKDEDYETLPINLRISISLMEQYVEMISSGKGLEKQITEVLCKQIKDEIKRDLGIDDGYVSVMDWGDKTIKIRLFHKDQSIAEDYLNQIQKQYEPRGYKVEYSLNNYSIDC